MPFDHPVNLGRKINGLVHGGDQSAVMDLMVSCKDAVRACLFASFGRAVLQPFLRGLIAPDRVS